MQVRKDHCVHFHLHLLCTTSLPTFVFKETMREDHIDFNRTTNVVTQDLFIS
jgi:hypothetical protein